MKVKFIYDDYDVAVLESALWFYFVFLRFVILLIPRLMTNFYVILSFVKVTTFACSSSTETSSSV